MANCVFTQRHIQTFNRLGFKWLLFYNDTFPHFIPALGLLCCMQAAKSGYETNEEVSQNVHSTDQQEGTSLVAKKVWCYRSL